MSIKTPFIREHKARLMSETFDKIERHSCPGIHTYSNVKLIPQGQCYDDCMRQKSDMIFEDTGYCAKMQFDVKEPCEYKTAMYGGYIRMKWGHFITETISRLWAIYDDRMPEVEKIIFFIDKPCKTLSGNYPELFSLLGIEDKIVICTSPVSVETLKVPDLGYEHDKFYTEEQAEVYRHIRDTALSFRNEADLEKHHEKIFLSRAGVEGAAREAVNLVNLENYFANNGFAVISPEKLSLSELIHVMHHATILASISGTPAHNFVFAPNASSKTFIIIERHAWVNPFQLSLNKMMGLTTEFVDAFYLPRPASAQDALMLFAPTPQFKAFVDQYKMSDNGEFVGDKVSTRRKELRSFLTRYRRYWCSGTALCLWEIDSGEAIIEAILASNERYNEWMKQSLPVMWYDYLSPRVLIRYLLYKIKH